MDEPLTGGPGRIGPYRIERRLGSGGMVVVYLGRDDAGRAAAVKVIRPEFAADATFRTRLRREVAAARRAPRFCTAPVLGADPDADPPWIATEYIDAPSLDVVLLERGRLRGAALETLAVGVAAALRAIHEQGVVHRDLKPSNILLTGNGPRVIDFGIARVEDAGTQQTRLTQVGGVVGTPAFMAPEQLRDEPVTTAVDVFAWASLLVYAATGSPPFGAGREAMHGILFEQPDLGDLEEPLRTLALAALDKNPARRPSASDLVDELSRGVSQTTTQVLAAAASPSAPAAGPVDESIHALPTLSPTDPPAARPATPPPRRRRWPVLIGVGVTLIAAVAASAAVWLPLGDSPEDSVVDSPAVDPDSAEDEVDLDTTLAGEQITIAVLDDWEESIAVSHLWGRVFEEAGATVTYQPRILSEAFAAVATGTADVIFSAWLPTTHQDYLEQYAADLEDLGAWYDEVMLAIAVNSDAPIQSLAEFAGNADAFDNRIVSIEPGAGIYRIARDEVMPTYDLNGIDLADSSTDSMLAELETATDAGENIAVTLWQPHWAYAAYPIRNLADPEGVLASHTEEIHSFARDGFSDDVPEAAEWVSNFYLTDQQTSELLEIVFVQDNGSAPLVGDLGWRGTRGVGPAVALTSAVGTCSPPPTHRRPNDHEPVQTALLGHPHHRHHTGRTISYRRLPVAFTPAGAGPCHRPGPRDRV